MTLKPDPNATDKGKFLCLVDAEHTARAVAHILARKRREALAHLIELRK